MTEVEKEEEMSTEINTMLFNQRLKDPLDYVKAQAVVAGIFLIVLFVSFLVTLVCMYIFAGSVVILIAGIAIVTIVLLCLLCCHGCVYQGIVKKLDKAQ